MTLNAKVLEEFRDRQVRILAGGGAEKARARHDQGRMTARERLAALFQDGTFQEIGMHIRSQHQAAVAKQQELPADGVIVGTGFVGGRPVAAFSQDFTVAAGTLGKMHATKIVRAMQTAGHTGMPVVAFNDSGGARIQEAVDALSGYGQVFYQNVLLSGVGTADRGNLRAMRRPRGLLTGADGFRHHDEVARRIVHHWPRGHQGGHRQNGYDGRGRQRIDAFHRQRECAFLAEDDHHAVQLVQRLLSFLPKNNAEEPPHQLSTTIDEAPDETITALIPEDSSRPMDTRLVITRLVDGETFGEVHAGFAENIVVGFARVEGMVVGIVADQPAVRAGALDIDASDKGARFIRFLQRLQYRFGYAGGRAGLFFPASSRNAAALSATGPSCCSPMPRPLSPRSPVGPAQG